MAKLHIFFVFAENVRVKESYAAGPRKLANCDKSVM